MTRSDVVLILILTLKSARNIVDQMKLIIIYEITNSV